MERIGAEVPLHDEPGVRRRIKARDPLLEKFVQLVLPHTDRRVRPDRHEGDVLGNILGPAGVDIVEAERLGVSTNEVKCSLVHIDRPHGGARGLESEGQRDRPPSAAEVEQVSTGRRRRGVREENVRSGVNSLRAEDAVRGREVVVVSGQIHAEGTELQCTCG